MKTYRTPQALNKNEVRRIVDIGRLYESLEAIYNKV